MLLMKGALLAIYEKTRLEMLCSLLLENARLLQLLLCVQLNMRWNWKFKSIDVVSVSEYF